ncbi:MAG TPA: hypothetical protein VF669_15870 [Tepidisphaeraceae bacterium]|jgi:hypothetical protein
MEALERRTFFSIGELDATFGLKGFAPVPEPTSDVFPLLDGRILTAGGSLHSPEIALTRFNADGTLDSTFPREQLEQTLQQRVGNTYLFQMDSKDRLLVVGGGAGSSALRLGQPCQFRLNGSASRFDP